MSLQLQNIKLNLLVVNYRVINLLINNTTECQIKRIYNNNQCRPWVSGVQG